MQHLAKCHDTECVVNELVFDSMPAFLSWKKDMEKKTRSHYVQTCSQKPSKYTKRFYFYCHRSGVYEPHGKGIRKLKSQGSNKIGHSCVASIKAVVNKNDGRVEIEYCGTHTHSVGLGALPILEKHSHLAITDNQQYTDCSATAEDYASLSESECSLPDPCNVSNIRQEIKTLVASICDSITETDDIDTLESGLMHLRNAYSVFKSEQEARVQH